MNIILNKRTTTIKFAIAILLLALSQLVISCNWPGENPDLVNPPLKSPSIGVRYLNLSGGGENRSLRMNYTTKIENIPYGTVSTQMNPPADSVFLTIDKNNSSEYEQKKPLKFMTRNVNYTFISLSSKKGAKNYKETDTIVWLSTSLINPENDNDAMLRLFSGNPDSTVSYSVRYGCPNGASIITQQNFGIVSTKFATIRSGEIPVSILKHQNNETTIIGVYKLNLKAKGQYCLIIMPYNDSQIVYQYDELSKADNALIPAELLIEKTAKIRILNFSADNYTVKTGQDEFVVDDLKYKSISDYVNIKACDSQKSDYLVFTGANVTDTLIASFEVMGVYNCIIADSKSTPGYKKILIPPLYFPAKDQNEATVRVVNAAWNRSSITLSMGLRNIKDTTKTGEILTKDLAYGAISNPINLQAGYAPLTSFTSTEPAQLLESVIGKLVGGKSYIIVLSCSPEGYDKIYIIEDADVSSDIAPLKTGVFTQIVAATAGVNEIYIDLYVDGTQYLSNIKIPSSGIVATVIPEGSATLSSGGKSHTTNSLATNRLLLVVSGDRSNTDIFDVNTTPMYIGSNFYRRRFLNAVYGLSEIAVKEEKDNPPNLAPVLTTTAYGKASDISLVWLESRKSFRFFDTSQNKEIFKSGDLSFSFNKSYSIVFAGSAPTGYSVIIVQEF
ncbi:MAG: hypothetical protein WCR42_00020 [bacterium]